MKSLKISTLILFALLKSMNLQLITINNSNSMISIEYQSTATVKSNFYGLDSKGWQAKMGVSSYKSLFNALMISLQ